MSISRNKELQIAINQITIAKKDLEEERQDQSLKKLTDAQRLNVNNFSKSSMKCLITDLLVHTQNYHNI